MFYTYAYCDPNHSSKILSEYGLNLLPFYIGYGQNDRMLSHMKTFKDEKSIRSNPIKCRKIARLIESGKIPMIVILKNFENKEAAIIHEKELIASIGTIAVVKGVELRGPLSNLHLGGNGGSIPKSPEGLIAISEKMRGRIITAEHRKKISDSKTGNTHHSKETRELISKRTSEALLANPEARKKISDTHKGRVLSEDHKKKVTDHLARMRSDPSFYDRVLQSRIDNNNLNHSEETKEKISTRTIEAMKNPDIIKRMKDSSKKRWSNPEERAKIALKNSKSFILTHKITGETFSITNLAQYCRDNKTHHRKVHLEFSVISSVHSVQ